MEPLPIPMVVFDDTFSSTAKCAHALMPHATIMFMLVTWNAMAPLLLAVSCVVIVVSGVDEH